MTLTLLKVADPERLSRAVKAMDGGTLRSVSAAAGISHTFLGGLCSGLKERASLDVAVRLAEVLGWDVADLFEVEDKEVLSKHGLI